MSLVQHKLLTAALAILAVVPLCVQAQPASPPVVGWPMFGGPERGAPYRERMRQGLVALGHEEGRTFRLEVRFYGLDSSRIPPIARELLEQKPTVVFTSCGDTLAGLRALSRTLPLIAACAEERNYLGEVASLRRPGGATTGIMFLAPESAGKRLEMLKEIRPDLKRVALLHHSGWEAFFQKNHEAAKSLGLSLFALPVARAADLDDAFATAVRERADAMVASFDGILSVAAARVAELAVKHRLATAVDSPAFADAGGLISYSADWDEIFHRMLPRNIDQILKGANPGDLPVVRPTKFTLVINLKTANALGITVPRALLLRADRVIQ